MKAKKFEWTEATWNPSIGCSKVRAGCKNCYTLFAEKIRNDFKCLIMSMFLFAEKIRRLNGYDYQLLDMYFISI